MMSYMRLFLCIFSYVYDKNNLLRMANAQDPCQQVSQDLLAMFDIMERIKCVYDAESNPVGLMGDAFLYGLRFALEGKAGSPEFPIMKFADFVNHCKDYLAGYNNHHKSSIVQTCLDKAMAIDGYHERPTCSKIDSMPLPTIEMPHSHITPHHKKCSHEQHAPIGCMGFSRIDAPRTP